MPTDGFKCKQCGHCCINLNAFATCASEADVQRWEEAGRSDILAWVEQIVLGDVCVYDIWLHSETGDDVSRCPWLQVLPDSGKYVCGIDAVKPDICRDFPVSREHAEKTGCPAFKEESDVR